MPSRTEPTAAAGQSAAASPPPARVPGNLWTAIEVPDLGALDPRATVSVVVSGDDPDGHLPLTLAALSEQTYPRSLVEVIVETESHTGQDVLREAAGDTDVKLSSQGAAGREPEGDVLVLLRAGSLPARGFIEAHARWHHVVADAVTAGPTTRIDPSAMEHSDVGEAQRSGRLEALLASRLTEHDQDQGALEAFLELTHGLTERRPDLFRIAARGSLSARSDTLQDAGGHLGRVEDPAVARLDLAYRLDCRGCLFVPEQAALAYGAYPEPWIAPGGPDEPDGDAARAPAHAGAASLIPVRGFRQRGTGRLFARPGMVVDVVASDERAPEILQAVDAVLRGRLSDVSVRVLLPDGHRERRLVEAACAADPRVQVVSPGGDARTDAPYQVTMPVSADPGDTTLEEIHDLMSDEGLGMLRVTIPSRADRLPLPGGRLADRMLGRGMLEIRATGPLARARRIAEREGETTGAVLGELFEARQLPGSELGLRRRKHEAEPADDGALGPAADLARERAEHLRFRARAATSQARADRQAQRLFRERLRSVHERTSADRLEARLARANPAFWVVWKTKRVGRRLAMLPKRLVARIQVLRHPLYRARLALVARLRRPRA